MIKRRRNKKQFQVDHNELSFLSFNKPWKQQEKVVTALEVLDCLRHHNVHKCNVNKKMNIF